MAFERREVIYCDEADCGASIAVRYCYQDARGLVSLSYPQYRCDAEWPGGANFDLWQLPTADNNVRAKCPIHAKREQTVNG